MVIDKFMKRMTEKKEALNRAQVDDRVHTVITERKKSANERELEKLMEEEREEKIKRQLSFARRRRQNKIDSMSVINKKNIFKNHKSILTSGPSILQGNNMFLLGR